MESLNTAHLHDLVTIYDYILNLKYVNQKNKNVSNYIKNKGKNDKKKLLKDKHWKKKKKKINQIKTETCKQET